MKQCSTRSEILDSMKFVKDKKVDNYSAIRTCFESCLLRNQPGAMFIQVIFPKKVRSGVIYNYSDRFWTQINRNLN